MWRSVVVATLAVMASLGCTPEVELARLMNTGGAGGTGDAAGSGGGGTGGTGGSVADAGEGGEPPRAPEARILADSVADFSLTQGEHGWYYGWDTGDLASFQLLGRISVIKTFMPPSADVWDCWTSETTRWTQIFRLGAHSNGTDTTPPSVGVLERAVRRWVSNYAGDVVITGEAAKIDLIDSNGVVAMVYVDGLLVASRAVDGDDGAGVSYEATASLRIGSTVDFVLDPLDGDDHHDLSRFTGIVTRVVE
jgi:hypothetical protein